jgi:SpoVK/Ycf46/Vps4 family AAA+-type ATPase
MSRGYGSGKSEEGASAESRVLATLLNELDGVGGGNHAYRNAEEVFVFGTTNRIEDIDAALLRKVKRLQIIFLAY